MKNARRTRVWVDQTGERCTMVQFRTDVTPMVYGHSGAGWMPVGNAPEHDDIKAEAFAEKLAFKQKLTEATKDFAEHLAGWK